MRMYLYADGAPFCLGTAASRNTRHDVYIVNARMHQLMADASYAHTRALFLRRDDVILNFIDARGQYFLCPDGIMKFHGWCAEHPFSIVPKDQRPQVIPIMQDKADAWFAEAASHQFPLVAHLGHGLKKKGDYRHDSVRPLVVDIPENDPDKSILGRPLVFPETHGSSTPVITDKFRLSDGTVL